MSTDNDGIATTKVNQLVLTNRNVSAANLASALRSAAHPLTALKLSFTNSGDESIPLILSNLGDDATHVRALTLQACDLTPKCIPDLCKLLAALTGLESLSLCDNHFTDEGIASLAATIAELKNFAYLNVGGNDLTDKGVMLLTRAVPALPQLKMLGLRGTGTGQKAFQTLKALSVGHPTALGLEQLHLKGVTLNTASARALADVVPHIPKLQVLDIQKTSLTAGNAVPIVDALVDAPSFTSLNMNDNHTGDGVADAIAGLLKHPQSSLRVLGLRRNDLTAVAVEKIATGLVQTRSLHGLDLSENPLMPGGCALMFDALRANASLQTLGVSSVGADAASVRSLCRALDGHPTVQHVDFCSNASGESGCQAWCELLRSPSCGISRLFLTDNSIPEGAAVLLVETLLKSKAIAHGNFGGQSKVPPLGNAISPQQQKMIQNHLANNRALLGASTSCLKGARLSTDTQNEPSSPHTPVTPGVEPSRAEFPGKKPGGKSDTTHMQSHVQSRFAPSTEVSAASNESTNAPQMHFAMANPPPYYAQHHQPPYMVVGTNPANPTAQHENAPNAAVQYYVMQAPTSVPVMFPQSFAQGHPVQAPHMFAQGPHFPSQPGYAGGGYMPMPMVQVVMPPFADPPAPSTSPPENIEPNPPSQPAAMKTKSFHLVNPHSTIW